MFTPGLFVLMALFGSISTSYGLLMELQSGVIERFRVTPVSRWALLYGLPTSWPGLGQDIVPQASDKRMEEITACL